MKLSDTLHAFFPVCCAMLLVTTAGAQAGPMPRSVTAPSAPVPASYFGMHIHKASPPKNMANFVQTPWPTVPFKSWRLWDTQTTWRQLEPQKGKWNFDLLDQDVALAEQKHVDVLMTLGQTPAWASSRPTEKTYFPGTAAEPTTLDDWDDYIRTLGTRYKGRIHLYEIWNEPNNTTFFSGSIPTLVQMSQRASAILKSIDPSIKIVSPGISRDADYLDRYLQAGGAKGVDVIGFHFYVHGQPEDGLANVAKVKQVLAKNGVASMPIWNTESGWGDWKDGVNTFTPDQAGAFVARANLLFWVSGVSRFYWYAWDDHQWVKLVMTQADNATETPAAQAYREMESWMVGNRFQSCQQATPGIWTCSLTRGGRPASIVWAPSGATTYKVPSSPAATTAVSLSGATSAISGGSVNVGPSPMLLY